jgi:hypothetical protein
MAMTDDRAWSLIFEGLERVSNELDQAWTALSDQPLLDRSRYSLPEAIRRALASRGGAVEQPQLPRAVILGTAGALTVGQFQVHLRPRTGGTATDDYDFVIRPAEEAGLELVVPTSAHDRRVLIRILSIVTPCALDVTPPPG